MPPLRLAAAAPPSASVGSIAPEASTRPAPRRGGLVNAASWLAPPAVAIAALAYAVWTALNAH